MRRAGPVPVVVAVLLCLICPAAAQTDVPEPAAARAGVVVSVHGSVSVVRGGEEMPIAEGLVLQDGDVVLARDGARCTGFTPSGQSFDLPGPGELRLEAGGGEGMLDRVSTWVRRQLTQWIGESRRQPIVTRALTRDWDLETLTPAPLVPAADGQVRPDAAVFYWGTVPGVDSYLVTFIPEDGEEFERVVRNHRLRLDDLEPGAEYVWKVRPAVEGWTGESAWRNFRVMLPDELRDLDDALEEMGDLEAGVLLLSAGLHEEAIYRLDAAIASETQGVSARLWRAQTLAEIGLYREAYEDLVLSWETP
ncbi:MAG: hypothetical protein GF400_02505 [Candidatus Eisenbacteria bacterium]|nr:hypothetical protein [Candidatus Eisenbacteria bacterium]